MSIDWKKIAWGGGILAVILIIALLLRFFFGGGGAAVVPAPSGGSFGEQGNTTSVSPQTSQNVPPPLFVNGGGTQAVSAVFKIADGPIAGAILFQTPNPTTTLARYISATDGHVYDLPLDSPGAVPRTVSNTTIPGIARVQWAKGGGAAVAQYQDSASGLRTISLQFPPSSATSTTRIPTGIHFFPDNLLGVALSPDGTSAAYLKSSSTGGTDGFVAPVSGIGEKKVFSFPLSQVVLSWPSAGSFLLYTKSAAGVPGAAFSIDAKNGNQTRLLSGNGLTASVDPAASTLVYTTDDGGPAQTFVQNMRSGTVRALSLSSITFGPLFPEQCVWGGVSSAMLYCAAAQSVSVPSGFLDLWHRGEASAADSLLSLDTSSGTTTVLATPSSVVGAEVPDIVALGVSQNGKYLFFITKHTRTLWGVRLTQN